jgi:hypothetical protein
MRFSTVGFFKREERGLLLVEKVVDAPGLEPTSR